MKKIILTAMLCLVFSGSVPGIVCFASLNINQLLPAHGPEIGGNEIAILGYEFSEGISVYFDDLPAVISENFFSSAIICTPPAHQAGSADVTVRYPDGKSETCKDCYIYDPGPTITTVNPVHGPASGGAIVTIEGSHFLAGVSVSFGSVPVTDITVISAEKIECLSPAHPADTIDVTVSNRDKQSAGCKSCYHYDPPPLITQMTPCPAHPDTPVTISGEHFSEGCTVSFNGIPGADVHFVSSSEISCKTPSQAEGMPRELVITNPDGQSVAYACAALPAPKIISPVVPEYGPVNGGAEVTITGYHFIEGVRVTFDGVTAEDVSLISDKKIRCIAPEHATASADVSVINPDNQSDNCTGCYVYKAGFTLAPAYGTTEGGTEVVITGQNFSENTAVSFDGIPAADIRFVSSSEIHCKSPVHDAGITDVTLTSPDSQADVCTGCYTYLSPSAPLKIGKVCEAQELDCKTASANLWVSGLIALNPIRRVWAIIIPPVTDPSVPVTYLPSVELEDSDNDGIYEGSFEDFSITGASYKVGIYAEDEEKYLAVPPLQTGVIRICRKGDIDRNGDVSLKDALIGLSILIKMNVSLPNNPAYKAVDADGDEKFGLAEVIYILKQLAEVK